MYIYICFNDNISRLPAPARPERRASRVGRSRRYTLYSNIYYRYIVIGIYTNNIYNNNNRYNIILY